MQEREAAEPPRASRFKGHTDATGCADLLLGAENSPRVPPKTFLFVSVEEGSMPSGQSVAPAASAAFVFPFELGCPVTAKDEDESPAHRPEPAPAGASTPR